MVKNDAGASTSMDASKKGAVHSTATPTLLSDGVGTLRERSFYRSAPMSLIQLYIPTEAAQAVVAELGELGVVQFRDLNPDVTAFQKTFTNDIRKLDEMERKVRILIEHANAEDVDIRSWLTAGPFTTDSQVPLRGKALQELEELEPELVETESRVGQLDENQQEITSRYLHTMEWLAVLEALSPYLSIPHKEAELIGSVIEAQFDSDETDSTDGTSTALHRSSGVNGSFGLSADDRETHSMELGGPEAAQSVAEATFVAGAIPKRKLAAFERVLWRALRGNVFVRSADCVIGSKPGVNTATAVNASGNETDANVPRSAFIAYVHGRETLMRLRKICEALGCAIYDVDPQNERRAAMIAELSAKADDMYAVLFNTRQAKRAALGKVSESLERWLLLIRKKKSLFDTMNFFSCDQEASTRKYFIAEGWCPTVKLGTIDAAIRMASERAGLNVAPVLSVLDSTGRVPPTYFPTNKFTQTFQDMTDSYGVGSYGEANPSLFMIISFPFLFAVMFGDIGHGTMMALFAAWMVLDERRLLSGKLSDIFEMIFCGRYVILLMGIFSVFTGFMYNDVFSRSVSLFPSMWKFVQDGSPAVRSSPTYTYPFGVDPAWALSSNGMSFLNSYKMKLAVLLGFTQMMFGLFVAASNHIYFGNWTDIWCTWVPQVLFMCSIFGYLVFLILYKWIAGWDTSILNTLINMLLKFGAVEDKVIFRGQVLIQTILMLTVLVCVPWMFFGKPVYLILQKRRRHRELHAYALAGEHSDSTGTESVSSTTRKALAEEEHDMGEVWVHQLIHTIEFVLGSVSNTASYLRLWALSLAHAQLSDVLWQMSIEVSVTNPFKLFVVFALWLAFTVVILVAMEGMSAFLHALRLHWVEFNNKFYAGEGVKFEPFFLGNDRLILSTDLAAQSNKK